MSSIEPIGRPDVQPTDRIARVGSRKRREREEQHHEEKPEEERGEDHAPPDDRPEPQHIDIRG